MHGIPIFKIQLSTYPTSGGNHHHSHSHRLQFLCPLHEFPYPRMEPLMVQSQRRVSRPFSQTKGLRLMLTGHLCLGSTMLIPPPSLMALEEVKILSNLLSYLVLEGGSVCLFVSFLLILTSPALLFGIAVAFLLYTMVCGAWKNLVLMNIYDIW